VALLADFRIAHNDVRMGQPEIDSGIASTTGPWIIREMLGVMLTQAMLRFAGEAVALLTAPRPGEVFLRWKPLYHIGGVQMLVLPLIRDVSLAMVRRFSASRFWRQARQSRQPPTLSRWASCNCC